MQRLACEVVGLALKDLMNELGNCHSLSVVIGYESHTGTKQLRVVDNRCVAYFASKVEGCSVHTGNMNEALRARDQLGLRTDLNSTEANVRNDNIYRISALVNAHHCIVKQFVANVSSFV